MTIATLQGPTATMNEVACHRDQTLKDAVEMNGALRAQPTVAISVSSTAPSTFSRESG